MHYALKLGYLDAQVTDTVTDMESSLRQHIQNAIHFPRFNQQRCAIVDQWDIVSVNAQKDTGSIQVEFEFILELHHHYETLQVRALRLIAAGQPPTYFPFTHLSKLPPVMHLIESCQFSSRKTTMGLNDRRFRA
ncbi:hypothetical protein [Chitinophaga filiformis]|uniref:Uncharacterized protein n=1 Tax=Chitinophaga filiformis TaxID=104663 RepID=A0ABY4HYC0_CHIFI|nr:hypothetical protein [Chitinophaga filiformis]UPK68009.1 hypothetical protein MYF79_23945 [Chitinophaga filiformis]